MNSKNDITPHLVDAEKAAQFFDVSERLFHKLRKDPRFPKAIVLGKRCVRWRVADLESYVVDHIGKFGQE